MNHNPHNLKVGDIVILDKEFNNASEVVISNFTPQQMYAQVYNKDLPFDRWEVMTYRLSPLNQQNYERNSS